MTEATLPAPVLGADIELGNAWIGGNGRSNHEASARLLRQLRRLLRYHGVGPHTGEYATGEWGRHWLKNGGCVYVDMSHLELCPPEVRSARDHAAAVHAMYRVARACRRRALVGLCDGEDLFLNAHNTDGTFATSWGAHQNVTVSRAFWEAVFGPRKPHIMALLASFVAATAPVFGQGAVLPLRKGARYATSARAHHVGSLVTLATTEPFNRGLLNSRDESHAGEALARLHLIAYDANLQPAAIFLRAGLLQLVVAALERGWFDAALLLDDPVEALWGWAWGFDVAAGAFRPPVARRPNTPPVGLFDWHKRLLDGLRAVVDAELVPDEIVPEGSAILSLWAETLDDLVHEDLPRLALRLDWALKWSILSQLVRSPDDLADPRLRVLDQHYGHVDDRVGLFWPFWRQGLIDPQVDSAAVRRFLEAGDPGTRSGLRGELVRRLAPWVEDIDWGFVEVARDGPGWGWSRARRRVDMPDPTAASGPEIRRLRALAPESDRQLLERLTDTEPRPRAPVAGPAPRIQLSLPLPTFDPFHANPPRTSDDDSRT